MSDLLSQDEVNALLQSVADLDSTDTTAAYTAAVEGVSVSTEQPDTTRPRATPFDFSRPSRISKDILRSLHFLHERYARSFARKVSAHLRAPCEVSLVSVEQLAYDEFLAKLPETTCLNVLRTEPQGRHLAFELSPALLFAVIEKLMGGGSQAPSQEREITALEERLVEDFIELALGDLRDTWQTAGEISFTLERRETSPRMVQIASPDEVVAAVVFEVKTGHTSGLMRFCLPTSYLESFAPQLHRESDSAIAPLTEQELARLDEVVASAKVGVSANICEVMLPIRKLLGLKVGETLSLGTTTSTPATVSIGGITGYTATYGARRGCRAVRILDSIDNDDATREEEAAPFTPGNFIY